MGMFMQSNKSVNHGTGDYHYNQQPRGTSFISQVSKRDLEERRQVRPSPPFQPQPQQWQQAPPIHQQQPVAPQPQEQAPSVELSNSTNELDSISANIKAMTSLLGDVKESLTAQTSDIRWLNKKYQEIEKRLERTEMFNNALSQDMSKMKITEKSTTGKSRFGPINDDRESAEFNEQDQEEKERLYESLDGIKDQMSRLDIAIKVGEVTLSSHMEDINRRFDTLENSGDESLTNNMNQKQQYYQPSLNSMNQQTNLPQSSDVYQQYYQPQPNIANQQLSQPQVNYMNPQFREPQPPPFQPISKNPNQSFPGSFQETQFQMGLFRDEAPRSERPYEIPSARQNLVSQSSATYNNQRRNKSFISSISERELAQRRELFQPVAPIPLFESGEYFDREYDELYLNEPFLDEGLYFEEDFF